MVRTYAQQKAALTRALKTQDPTRVRAEVARAIGEWKSWGYWPDDWSRWERALWDVGITTPMEELTA